jgi:hypothetical protein
MVKTKGVVLIAICFLMIGVALASGYWSFRVNNYPHRALVSYGRSLLQEEKNCTTKEECDSARDSFERLPPDVKLEAMGY